MNTIPKAMQTWVAMLTTGTRTDGVYSVSATSEKEAQDKIERELSVKPYRASLLQRWKEQGKRVRVQGERKGKG